MFYIVDQFEASHNQEKESEFKALPQKATKPNFYDSQQAERHMIRCNHTSIITVQIRTSFI